MFSPDASRKQIPQNFLPTTPQQDEDDGEDGCPSEPSILIRKLNFTMAKCMTPGRAIKRARPTESVQVFLRIRASTKEGLEISDMQTLKIRHPVNGSLNTFKFSEIFDATASQETIYQKTAAPLVKSLLDDHRNSLIFTYGITNSGKTYTVEGTAANPGILPKTLQDVFNRIDNHSQPVDVYASFLEIHNESVIDLLSEELIPKGLQLVANRNGSVFVKNLTEVLVRNIAEASLVVAEGTRRRQVAETALNCASSRSHCMFSVKLVLRGIDKDEGGTLAKLCIVDLAGSERASRAKNANDDRCREANNINTSLMHLGRCLEIVRWNQEHPDCRQRPIPWRDSKVLRLFKDYFIGGWGRAVMIANVNPELSDRTETLHALKFAALASEIENTSKIDLGKPVDISNDDVEEELLEQIYQLKMQLLESERRRWSTEVEVRNAVCNEMQEQLTRQEHQFQQQLEEEIERSRNLNQMRFDIWKKNVFDENATGVDINKAIQIAVHQLEAQNEVLSQQDKASRKQLQAANTAMAELQRKLGESLKSTSESNAALEKQRHIVCNETIANLESRKLHSEKQCSEAEDRADFNEKRLQDSERKVSGLEKKIVVLNDATAHLKKKIQEQQQCISSLELARTRDSAEIAKWRTLSQDQDVTIKELQSAIEASIKKQTDCESQVSQLLDLNAMQKDVIEASKASLIKADEEKEDIRRRLLELESASVDATEAGELMGKQQQSLRETIKKLEQSLKREKAASRKKLSEERAALKNSNFELQNYMKSKEMETLSLQNEFSQNIAAMKENHALLERRLIENNLATERENDDLRKRVSHFENAHTASKTSHHGHRDEPSSPLSMSSPAKKKASDRKRHIISCGDQENMQKTFGKRSNAILAQNSKWSSILTGNTFESVEVEPKVEPRKLRRRIK
uniref:Kinesin-like protein n=1 Tax=Spongospora subterranea TaxID=70186 RepID=A0A0H5R776_9EUKA|eukprot:CRZ09995.1 hypothetical protein [Spongospora subterranea]